MVKIACVGESKVVRSMMENLVELVGEDREIVIWATRCVVKIQIHSESPVVMQCVGGRWTLTCQDNTGNIKIHSSAGEENELMDLVEKS